MASYITGRTAFHCFRKCGYSWKGFILPQLWITGVLSYFYKLPRRQWNALDCHLSVLEGQLRTHKKFKSCHNRRDDMASAAQGRSADLRGHRKRPPCLSSTRNLQDAPWVDSCRLLAGGRPTERNLELLQPAQACLAAPPNQYQGHVILKVPPTSALPHGVTRARTRHSGLSVKADLPSSTSLPGLLRALDKGRGFTN